MTRIVATESNCVNTVYSVYDVKSLIHIYSTPSFQLSLGHSTVWHVFVWHDNPGCDDLTISQVNNSL